MSKMVRNPYTGVFRVFEDWELARLIGGESKAEPCDGVGGQVVPESPSKAEKGEELSEKKE